MLHQNIINIAVSCGWQVSITPCGNGGCYIDFQRMTRNGLSFCFTATMAGGRISMLVDEIISFVDALDPERYACEWMETKGDVSPTRYLKAVDDMDEMRTLAWLLAIDLSTVAEKEALLLDFPWYYWN